MDGWNTIVSRCFSFSLGYVSFLEGGEWFLRGYRRSRVKLLGANICSLSTIMAQVNHGVPDTDSRFLYKIGIVLFKTKKQWWVFSRVLSQNVKSVLLRKNLRYVGYYIGFFHVLLSTGNQRTKAYRPSISTDSWKKWERSVFLPSPTLNAGALCDFLHLLGLTLQGVGFSLRCFFLGRQQEVTSQTLNEGFSLLWMICWGDPLGLWAFMGVFFWFYHL